MSKFNIEITAFGEEDDSPMFVSLDLNASGDTEDEVYENAVYYRIDQDGGDLGSVEADDDKAQEYIKSFFMGLTDEERINGKSVAI